MVGRGDASTSSATVVGTVSSAPQPGHFTFLPAALLGALYHFLHAVQSTRIGILVSPRVKHPQRRATDPTGAVLFYPAELRPPTI